MKQLITLIVSAIAIAGCGSGSSEGAANDQLTVVCALSASASFT